MKKFIVKTSLLAVTALTLTACRHEDAKKDDLPQEEMSDVILHVTDVAGGATSDYDYQIKGNVKPTIKLTNGHTYNVIAEFKNGKEDVTSEIREAKDEHFLVYDFPNSDIELTRTDDASTTRKDGNRVGLKTTWKVNKASNKDNAELILTLYHEPKTVSETAVSNGSGKTYGTHEGGETDAKATYNLAN